jgi:hypothetical protein
LPPTQGPVPEHYHLIRPSPAWLPGTALSMADLKNQNVIVIKGLLFLLVAVMASAAIFCLAPSWRTVVLLLVLIWASARFYYFLFYVLYAYVDSRYKYAGIVALLKSLARQRKDDDK